MIDGIICEICVISGKKIVPQFSQNLFRKNIPLSIYWCCCCKI